MALRVLGGQIVAVVGADQGDARLLVEAQDALVDDRLVPDAVVLELQVEAVLPEDLPHLQGVPLGVLVGAVDELLGDLPGQAGGQGDEPPGVLPQELHVNAGPDVEALHVAHAHQVAQVPVALLVPAEEDQVAALGVELVDLLKAGAALGCDVDLAADNGLDALLFAGPVEVDGPVHDAVVGDSHRRLAQLPYPAGQAVDAAEAVQQAVLRMDMEVCK